MGMTFKIHKKKRNLPIIREFMQNVHKTQVAISHIYRLFLIHFIYIKNENQRIATSKG